MLHVAECVAQTAHLVLSPRIGQFFVELAGGYRLGLLGQSAERLERIGDKFPEYEQHEQQADDHNDQDRQDQALVSAKDVFLGADDGHAPASRAQGAEEDVTVVSVYLQLPHARLACNHGPSKSCQVGVGIDHRGGEDCLQQQSLRIGMHQIGAAPANHDAV